MWCPILVLRPLLFAILCILGFQVDLSAAQGLKTGTWENDFTSVAFIIESEHRRNRNLLNSFIKEIEQDAMPPRNTGVYEVKSVHLGVWAIVLDWVYSIPKLEHLRDVVNRHEALIRAWSRLEYTEGISGPSGINPDHDIQNKVRRDGFVKQTDPFHKRSRLSTRVPRKLIRRPRIYGYNRKRSNIANVFLGSTDHNGSVLRARASGDNIVAVKFDLPLKPADLAMALLSQPPGVSIAEMETQGEYYKYSNGGKGVAAYVMDTGCSLDHPEFAAQMKKGVHWIFTGHFPADEKKDYDESSDEYPEGMVEDSSGYHGTRVAAKIVGSKLGTAPGADLVIARTGTGRQQSSPLHDIDILLRIYDHRLESIAKGKNRHGAVITMAYSHREYFDADPDNENLIHYQENLLKLFVDIIEVFKAYKTYILVAAGSLGPDEPITKTYPQNLGGFSPSNFVVVGGIDTGTRKNKFQKADWVELYAPGTDNELPVPMDSKRGQNKGIYEVFDGATSIATATVAGIFAVYLGQVDSDADFDPVEKAKDLAYPRIKNGPKVVWNGISRDKWPVNSGDDRDRGTGNTNGDGSGGGGEGRGHKRPPNDTGSESGSPDAPSCGRERRRLRIC
ncbi:Suppressor of the cold-sensitive snRNP biogenesis mutant brr1-1 [Arthrobotrys megalospora]